MSFKNLVGKRVTKEVNFMGEKIKISKLSVDQVFEIQEKSKGIKEDSDEGLKVLRDIIRLSVEDASDVTDEQFNAFPMDELSGLTKTIMEFSGLGEKAGK